MKTGFYEGISELKTRDLSRESSLLLDHLEDYHNILDVCKAKKDLPNISLEDSTKLLHLMKANVIDIFSIFLYTTYMLVRLDLSTLTTS